MTVFHRPFKANLIENHDDKDADDYQSHWIVGIEVFKEHSMMNHLGYGSYSLVVIITILGETQYV